MSVELLLCVPLTLFLSGRKQGKPELSSSEEEEEEEEEEEPPKSRTFRGAKPSGDSLFGSDAESEASESGASFIVGDDGAAPVQLPAAFSLDTFQDLAHQFKKIFQFFCHIAVQPPDERHDFMEHALKSQCCVRPASLLLTLLRRRGVLRCATQDVQAQAHRSA